MEAAHEHVVENRTIGCFETFIGCTVKAILVDPDVHFMPDITLVFTCGWGLQIGGRDAGFWVHKPIDVGRTIARAQAVLEDVKGRLETVLKLTGGS